MTFNRFASQMSFASQVSFASQASAVRTPAGRTIRIAATLIAAGVLGACQDSGGLRSMRAYQPIPPETLALMQEKNTNKSAPILIRTFKKEAELEIWKMTSDGAYALLKTYPMCRWSGQLGPKKREGDRQVPEGFYTITPGQMNPNSNYYLSFNVGYPNAYDKAHGYTGGMIMVHGDCSSAGCYSMTDKQIAEIYAVTREAFAGGQQAIQMQSMPFRMTPQNLAKHRLDPNMPFWKEIKNGADAFEVTKRQPRVAVCGRRYVFNATADGARLDAAAACPPLQEDAQTKALVAEHQREEDGKVADLVAKGVGPVKVVYSDGGQHPQFANVSVTSRPDALAKGPVEIALEDKTKPSAASRLASVKTDPSAQARPGGTQVAGSVVGSVVKSDANKPGGESAVATAFASTGAIPAGRDLSFFRKFVGSEEALKNEPTASTPVAIEPVTPFPAMTRPVRAGSIRTVSVAAKPAAVKSGAVTPPRRGRTPSAQDQHFQDPRRKTLPQNKTSALPLKTSALPDVIRGGQQPLPSGVLSFAQ